LLQAFDIDPRRILRRRSSLVVDDLPADFKRHSLADDAGITEEPETTNGVNGKSKETEKKQQNEKMPLSPTAEKKKPTQFEEPDANSLLDSFGF
jgi:rabconnectin-3a